jgi:hypothetical protein
VDKTCLLSAYLATQTPKSISCIMPLSGRPGMNAVKPLPGKIG